MTTKKKMGMMEQVMKRLESPTPPFWLRIRKWAVRIAIPFGTSILAGILANRQFDLGIDPAIIIVCGYIVFGCAIVAGMSFLTTTNAALSKE